MLEESAERPLVMSVVLHSFILGQPHRLRRFCKVIAVTKITYRVRN